MDIGELFEKADQKYLPFDLGNGIELLNEMQLTERLEEMAYEETKPRTNIKQSILALVDEQLEASVYERYNIGLKRVLTELKQKIEEL